MDTRILVIDCGSTRVGKIQEILRDLGAFSAAISLEDTAMRQPDLAHGVVISGGPHLFTGPEGSSLTAHFGFLRELSVPTLGICLGHQALGVDRGIEVFRGAERHCLESVELLVEHPLVAGLPRKCEFLADHVEGIPLPPGFRRIARSRHYDVEIMADDARGRFGVQFHPEASGGPGLRILANFLSIVRGISSRDNNRCPPTHRWCGPG